MSKWIKKIYHLRRRKQFFGASWTSSTGACSKLPKTIPKTRMNSGARLSSTPWENAFAQTCPHTTPRQIQAFAKARQKLTLSKGRT